MRFAPTCSRMAAMSSSFVSKMALPICASRVVATAVVPSTITLKTTIEEAIYKAAPDLDGVALEDLSEVAQPQSKPLTFVPRRRKDSQDGQIAVHPTSNGLSAPTR